MQIISGTQVFNTSSPASGQKNLFCTEVSIWAKKFGGEEFVEPIMHAYDEGAKATPGDEVVLDLSASKFTVCPPFPPNLTNLNLSDSNVTVLPDDFASQLPNLKDLDVSRTPLKKLPARLPPQLTVLVLCYTDITALPENLPTLLEELWLTGCMKLIFDPVNLLAQLPHLERLDGPRGTLDESTSFGSKGGRRLFEHRLMSTTFGTSYQQNYPHSCAAASLLVIAHELGVKKSLPSSRPDSESDTLELDVHCEKSIYRVTSAFEGQDAGLEKARGSLPPNIIRAARQLGLAETFYVPDNHHTQTMRNDADYPKVEPLLAKEGITIHQQSAPRLSSDALEMRFVTRVDARGVRLPGAWDEVNHCVAVRPDASCMDPASGINFKSIDDYIACLAGSNQFLEDTGMRIQFKLGSAGQTICPD